MAGKSSLLKSIQYENIPKQHDATIGVDLEYIRRKKNNNLYKICLWDTSGSKSFKTITQSYYNDSIVCIIMFDLTKLSSFNEAIEWYYHYTQYKLYKSNDLIILVGNKLDNIINNKLTTNNLTYGNIGKYKISQFVDSENIPYIEISTLTRHNVEDLISFIMNDIEARIKSGILSTDKNKGISVKRYVKGHYIPYNVEEICQKKSWFSKIFK